MYPHHDDLRPAPAAGAPGRGIGYVTAGLAAAFALWALGTGGALFALPFAAYAVAVPVSMRSPSPVTRGLAVAAAVVSGFVCLAFLTMMMVLMSSDF